MCKIMSIIWDVFHLDSDGKDSLETFRAAMETKEFCRAVFSVVTVIETDFVLQSFHINNNRHGNCGRTNVLDS